TSAEQAVAPQRPRGGRRRAASGRTAASCLFALQEGVCSFQLPAPAGAAKNRLVKQARTGGAHHATAPSSAVHRPGVLFRAGIGKCYLESILSGGCSARVSRSASPRGIPAPSRVNGRI